MFQVITTSLMWNNFVPLLKCVWSDFRQMGYLTLTLTRHIIVWQPGKVQDFLNLEHVGCRTRLSNNFGYEWIQSNDNINYVMKQFQLVSKNSRTWELTDFRFTYASVKWKNGIMCRWWLIDFIHIYTTLRQMEQASDIFELLLM